MTVNDLTRPAHPAMILSAIMTALGAIATLIPFVAFQQLAVIYFADGQPIAGITDPWVWVVIAIVALGLGQILYLGGLGVTHVAEAKLRYRLRTDVVAKIDSMPLGKVSQLPHGRIRKMVCDDTGAIHEIVAHLPGDFTNAVVSILVGAGYLFFVDWRLMSLLLGVWIVLTVVVGAQMRGYGDLTERFGAAETNLSSATVEMLEGIKEIKNFQATDITRTNVATARQTYSDISYEWASGSGKVTSVLGALWRPSTIFVTTALAAAWFVSQGWMPLSDTLPFFLITPGIPAGFSTFIGMTQHLYAAQMAAQNTINLLTEDDMPEGNKTDGTGPEPGKVEFEDVTFSYKEGTPVVDDVSFTVEPGTVTALVGPSGGGKTTIARLIARFYDVDQGTVRVSGVDVREAHSSWLLSQVAVVLQDVALTNDSVADNIAMADPTATREQIEQAAKAAFIHDRICQLPNGYDTILGEEGGLLSGGERQRITLARAYLQDCPILILDEATAQADPQSEREIHRALNSLARGKTVIMIAHRLWTIQDADQILVVDSGRITERGRHEDLLAAGGTYTKMWDAQQLAAVGEQGGEA
ncbi:ABC transporter ATP-binding protein [Trueperella bialowiezensis]|nr:ABC transporter ATP-binding protein [Trueperella bialowiezensis]